MNHTNVPSPMDESLAQRFGATVLVAEDNPSQSKLLKAQLESANYAVLTARDGHEALDILKRQPVDAVISDIMMPRMDGYALCHEVRRHPEWSNIPFIIYSSTFIEPSDEKLSLGLGADKYLKKPAAPIEILAALYAAMSGRRPHPSTEADPSCLRLYCQQVGSKLEKRHGELSAAKLSLEQTVLALKQKAECLAAREIELQELNNELIQTQRHLKYLLSKSPTVVYHLKIENGKIKPTWVSENIEEMTGFRPDQFLSFEWWEGRLHPDDRERALNEIASILSSPPASREYREYRFRRRDGSYLWIQDERRLMKDPKSSVEEIVGSWTDITERKELELQAALRERQLTSFFQSATAGLCILDDQFRYRHINERLASMDGRPVAAHIGKTVAEVVPDLWPILEPHFKEVLATGRSITRLEFFGETPAKRGVTQVWSASYFPMIGPQGRPNGIGALVLDVTQLKRAEQKLAIEYEVTRILSESANLSQAAAKFLEIICQRLHWTLGLLFTEESGIDGVRCAGLWHQAGSKYDALDTFWQQLSFKRGAGFLGQVFASGNLCRKSSLIDLIEGAAAPLPSHLEFEAAIGIPITINGKSNGVLQFFSDQPRQPDSDEVGILTALAGQIGQFIERKNIEEQLRQSQKLDAIGQVATGVAHDLNNILTVIQGFSGLLLSGQPMNPPPGALNEIFSATERASALTRKLLTFGRKQPIQITRFDLSSTTSDLMNMLRRIIPENISLHFTPTPGPCCIDGDPAMLDHVLLNLAINARDAMAQGGRLDIGVTTATRHELDSRNIDARPGCFACLTVRDTGTGISPALMPHIFEPFVSTKTGGKGTGMGLANVYAIVKQHRGWIDVDTKVGAGTEFRVYLPLVSPESAASSEAPPQPSVREIRGSETILLVEDDPTIRVMASLILQKYGYQVIEADSGEKALEIWEQNRSRIALVFTDVIMTGPMTGLDLAEALHTRAPDLKVIFSSGYSSEAARQQVGLEREWNFLQKPYAPSKLAETIRTALDA